MRRAALLVAALVVVGAGVPLVAASPSFGADPATGAASVQEEAGNNSTAPGAQLASVVNVQAAEVEGDLARRAFGVQLAAAKSNASTAAVLAEQTDELSTRLAELKERKQTLLEARQNGSISQARFRAEMAGLVAEISTANRLLNRTSGVAQGLPSSVLAEHGVDTEALTRLREAAGNLSGPAVSTIAGNVTGVGNVSLGPPGNVSVDAPGNGTDGLPGEDDGDGDGVLGDDDGDDDAENQTTTTTVLSTTTLPTTTDPPVGVTTTVNLTTTVVNVTTNLTSVGGLTLGFADGFGAL